MSYKVLIYHLQKSLKKAVTKWSTFITHTSWNPK